MSSSRADILQATLEILARHARTTEKLTEQTQLVPELGIDSLGVMDALAEIEDRFGVSFEDEELQEISTLGDLIAAIAARRVDTSS